MSHFHLPSVLMCCCSLSLAAGAVNPAGGLCMQVQPIQPVEVDSSTYHYEDYLADMGNTASVEHGSVETSPPMDTEANHIGRLQAITGARAVETKVKPRGPKAEPADYEEILVGSCAGMVAVLQLSCRAVVSCLATSAHSVLQLGPCACSLAAQRTAAVGL